MVRRMLERRRQNQELHIHHQRGDVRDRERAIVRRRIHPRAPSLRPRSTVVRKPILIVAIQLAVLVFAFTAAAQVPPPAPTIVAPAAGAALVQPITLSWTAVTDPDGPIGSYTWEISNTSTFGFIIASGFANASGDPTIPIRTQDRVSGLPNGTYFWRVKATAMVGGEVFALDSPFSTVQSFTIVGLGPAPATPTFTSPANNAQFNVR